MDNLRTIKAFKTGYTEQHISEMVQLVLEKNWDGPVTFAG